jgi:entericidin B
MRILITAILVVMVLGLSGCETMKGVGKDVEKGGEAIQRQAD